VGFIQETIVMNVLAATAQDDGTRPKVGWNGMVDIVQSGGPVTHCTVENVHFGDAPIRMRNVEQEQSCSR
jgi:hypothetical protein